MLTASLQWPEREAEDDLGVDVAPKPDDPGRASLDERAVDHMAMQLLSFIRRFDAIDDQALQESRINFLRLDFAGKFAGLDMLLRHSSNLAVRAKAQTLPFKWRNVLIALLIPLLGLIGFAVFAGPQLIHSYTPLALITAIGAFLITLATLDGGGAN